MDHILNPKYPYYYFKYRNFSISSLKEIFYGEIFFAERSEINDPYDTKIPYIFKADYGKYLRMFEYIIDSHFNKDILLKKYFVDAAKVLSKFDLSYEQLIEKIDSNEFKDSLILQMFNKVPESFQIVELFIHYLMNEIHQAVGRFIYITSFTKRCDNPIMWSHYADNHKGFCLIFKPYDNCLYIDPFKNIDLNNKKLHPMKRFEFKEVKYNKRIKTLDGFINFNSFINGGVTLTQKQKEKYWASYSESASIKFNDWRYEEEVRLIDVSHWMPSSITVDGAKKKPSIQRVFHYDKTQFCGIIFGSKMKADDKDELICTVEKMREELFCHKKCHSLPIFSFYNAVQKSMEFVISSEFHLGLNETNYRFEKDTLDENILNCDKAIKYYKAQKDKPEYIIFQ